MTNAAAELLASKPNVLLDFDGPICSVFGGVGAEWVALELRRRLGLSDEHSFETQDPFDILRYAAAEGQREVVEAERELTKLEVEAVASATYTPGALELLQVTSNRGQCVSVVSNNSAAGVNAYLNSHGLSSLVHNVSARTEPDPTLLKPNPHLLRRAIEQSATTPERCVMIGDSVSDIQAAHAVGTPVIAYVNKPGKRHPLLRYQPDAVVRDLTSLFDR